MERKWGAQQPPHPASALALAGFAKYRGLRSHPGAYHGARLRRATRAASCGARLGALVVVAPHFAYCPIDRNPETATRGVGAAEPPTSATLGLAKTAVSCTSLLPACFGSGLRAATVGGTAASTPSQLLLLLSCLSYVRQSLQTIAQYALEDLAPGCGFHVQIWHILRHNATIDHSI